MDEKEAEKVAMEMLKGDFTLEMFLHMNKMMKKMGSMGDIMKMMGLGGMLGMNTEQQKQVAIHSEKMMHLYETAINSMTPRERKNPDLIDFSRRRRIAKGSGLQDKQVGQMLNEFNQMKSMFPYLRQMMAMGGGGLPGMPGIPGLPGMGGGGGMGMPGMPRPGGYPGGMPALPGSMPRPGGAQAKGFSRGRMLRKRKKKH